MEYVTLERGSFFFPTLEYHCKYFDLAVYDKMIHTSIKHTSFNTLLNSVKSFMVDFSFKANIAVY